MSPSKTGLLYDKAFLNHDTGRGHPERPDRLRSIMKHLEKTGLSEQLKLIQAKPIDRKLLELVHDKSYIDHVIKSCKEGRPYLDSRDTPISPKSYGVASLAAGGVIETVEAVMNGEINNAFCAIRPPGHHAFADRASGFCIFNNVAIAAKYLISKHHLKRILIIDWDVHHGNGTQAIFYEDPQVFFFSSQQFPFYPGTGDPAEKGRGKGLGYTHNIPLRAGCGDDELVALYEKELIPLANKFKPEFILISAGFDPHIDDPLGGLKITDKGFSRLTEIICEIAKKHCEGKLVSMLEGGYDLEGISRSIEGHLKVLIKHSNAVHGNAQNSPSRRSRRLK